MLSRSRTAARSAVAGVALASPLIALATAAPASADVPAGWEEGSTMSLLDVLLVFVGIPVALGLVLTVFAVVLARRTTPSYLPYVASPGKALGTSSEHAEISSGH